MKDFRDFIDKNSSFIKYTGLVLAIFWSIIATRTYLNYDSIETAIEEVKTETINTQEEMAYTENFLSKYLWSEFADFFLAHENNILEKNEYIIEFKTWTGNIEDMTGDVEKFTSPNRAKNPRDSRRKFLKEKFWN